MAAGAWPDGHAARPRTNQRLNLNHAQNAASCRCLSDNGPTAPAVRETKRLHDPMELIQYAGNGKLHRVGCLPLWSWS